VNSERTLETEYIYNGKLVNLRIDTVELPSGRKTRREIVEHGACCAIVPIDEEDNVLLVSQYRKPVDKVLLEIPAGNIEPDENPLSCARRELEEETGFSAHRWDEMSVFYTSPGFCTEEMHLFMATGLRPSERSPDIDEFIKLQRVPMARIPEMIAGGEIGDAKSIAGLLMAQNRIRVR